MNLKDFLCYSGRTQRASSFEANSGFFEIRNVEALRKRRALVKSLEKYQYWNDPDGKLSSGSFHLQNCGNSQVRVRPTALTNGDARCGGEFRTTLRTIPRLREAGA